MPAWNVNDANTWSCAKVHVSLFLHSMAIWGMHLFITFSYSHGDSVRISISIMYIHIIYLYLHMRKQKTKMYTVIYLHIYTIRGFNIPTKKTAEPEGKLICKGPISAGPIRGLGSRWHGQQEIFDQRVPLVRNCVRLCSTIRNIYKIITPIQDHFYN